MNPTFADVFEQFLLKRGPVGTRASLQSLADELVTVNQIRPKCSVHMSMLKANRTAESHGLPIRFVIENGICWLAAGNNAQLNPAIEIAFVPKRTGSRKLPPVCSPEKNCLPGTNLQVLHLDDQASGIVKVHATNSPIACILAPWSLVRELNQRDDYLVLSDVGAYVLICRDAQGVLRFRVGESLAQGLVGRIATHEISETHTPEYVFLVTFVDRRGKHRLHTRHLQHHLYRAAIDAFNLPPVLPQNIEPDLLPSEEALPLKPVLDQIRVSAQALGLNIFNRYAQYPADRTVFRITTKHRVWAEGWEECRGGINGFLIRAGSMLAKNVKGSLRAPTCRYYDRRALLLDTDGPVRELNGELRFLRDTWFSSAHQAASIVLGQSASETKTWEVIKDVIPFWRYKDNLRPSAFEMPSHL